MTNTLFDTLSNLAGAVIVSFLFSAWFSARAVRKVREELEERHGRERDAYFIELHKLRETIVSMQKIERSYTDMAVSKLALTVFDTVMHQEAPARERSTMKAVPKKEPDDGFAEALRSRGLPVDEPVEEAGYRDAPRTAAEMDGHTEQVMAGPLMEETERPTPRKKGFWAFRFSLWIPLILICLYYAVYGSWFLRHFHYVSTP